MEPSTSLLSSTVKARPNLYGTTASNPLSTNKMGNSPLESSSEYHANDASSSEEGVTRTTTTTNMKKTSSFFRSIPMQIAIACGVSFTAVCTSLLCRVPSL